MTRRLSNLRNTTRPLQKPLPNIDLSTWGVDWELMARRYLELRPYAEIGKSLDKPVSRQRVHQLLMRDLELCVQQIATIDWLLTELESLESALSFNSGDKLSFEVVASRIRATLLQQGVALRLGACAHLGVAVRGLIYEGIDDLAGRFPKSTYLICRAAVPIEKHLLVDQEIKRSKVKWTYVKLARAVLIESNNPLHYKEIFRRAELIVPLSALHLTSFYNVLHSKVEVFTRTEPGTYGLTQWGIVTPKEYTKIIDEVLSAETRPMLKERIHAQIEKVRPISAKSLQMYLELEPRYYRSMEGTYGLRDWLLARSKQTISTPKWRVEDPQSMERIERLMDKKDVDKWLMTVIG